MIIGLSNSNSYLGFSLSKYLSSSAEHTCIVATPTDLISNPKLINLEDIQVYIYLDHPSRTLLQENHIEYFQEACMKPLKVAVELSKYKVSKFLYIGSHWQEPNGSGYQYRNNYALSKQVCQNLLEGIATDEFKVAVLHLFDVYGENDFRNKTLSRLYAGELNIEELQLENPLNWVSPIHITDAVKGIFAAASIMNSDPTFTIYSIAGPNRFRMRDLQAIDQVFDEDPHAKSDIKALSRYPAPHGWKPKVQFNLQERDAKKVGKK